MRKIFVRLLLVTAILIPSTLWAETWKDVSLMDHNCTAKFEGKEDQHPVSCALQCAKSGYGIVVDGTFLPFDDHGNDLALAALKSTKKTKAIRVTVDGKREGETLHVTKLSID